MKTIGLIGGMSWESTQEYYRIINETVRKTLGGLHSAKCLIYSFDFQEIEELQASGHWDRLTGCMIDAAKRLEEGGADFVLICTHTMHIMAEEVEHHISIPLLHIADATAEQVRRAGIKTVGLLGTKFTMEKDFYRGRLAERFGIDTVIPSEEQREIVHRIIYSELCRGEVNRSSRKRYREIIDDMSARGAKGVVLGCTEIPLLIKAKDVDIPLFDTTRIHAESAVDHALR